MITIGEPHICEFRKMSLERGTVLAFAPTDHVTRFWLGNGVDRNGRNVDLLFGEVRAEDGSMFFMGRVREHFDDKVWDTSDEKHIVQLGIGPGAFRTSEGKRNWELSVGGILSSAKMYGMGRIYMTRVDGDQDAFINALCAKGPEFGIEISMKSLGSSEGPSSDEASMN